MFVPEEPALGGRKKFFCYHLLLSLLIRRSGKFNSVGVCRAQMQSRSRQTLAFCLPCSLWAPTKPAAMLSLRGGLKHGAPNYPIILKGRCGHVCGGVQGRGDIS